MQRTGEWQITVNNCRWLVTVFKSAHRRRDLKVRDVIFAVLDSLKCFIVRLLVYVSVPNHIIFT